MQKDHKIIRKMARNFFSLCELRLTLLKKMQFRPFQYRRKRKVGDAKQSESCANEDISCECRPTSLTYMSHSTNL
jgi:hypothetical protein